MPSFSEMFPTYAKFFSKLGSLVAPPKRITADGQSSQGPNPPATVDANKAVEPVAPVSPRSAPEITSVSTAGTPESVPPEPGLSADETQVLQMYQSWVELDKSVVQAQENLKLILDSRGKADFLRSQAQEMLEEAEASREEAQRIGDAAWRAFDRGFATNIRGFANRRAMVREIDLSRRTQAELQRNVHRKTWEEAERSREESTAQVLNALNNLAIVAGQVERELAEATNLPILAEALKESAQEELRCAEAVKHELLLLAREALNQLDLTPTSEYEYTMEESLAREMGTLETETQGLILGVGGTPLDSSLQPPTESQPRPETISNQTPPVSDSLSWEAASTEDVLHVSPVVLGDVSAGTAPVSDLGPSSQEPNDEAMAVVDPIPVAPPPLPESEIAGTVEDRPAPADPAPPPVIQPEPARLMPDNIVFEPPSEPEPPLIEPLVPEPVVPDPPEPEPMIPAAPPSSTAQDLIREMEEARAFAESSQTPAISFPDPAPEESEQPPAPIEGEIVYPQAELEEPEPSTPAGGTSAAEQLIRDFEAARAAAQPAGPPPIPESPTATQDLILDTEGLAPPAGIDQPEPLISSAPFPAPVPVEPPTPGIFAGDEAPSTVPLGHALEQDPQPQAPITGQQANANYSGLIYLMFPATLFPYLTQDGIGLVWQALEEVARGSQILDSRLLSDSEGIQFTVQLGAAGLVEEDLGKRLVGAEFEELAPDRLKVNWPRR